MGSSQTKDKNSPSEKAVENLKNKVRLLQSEINEAMLMRETENRVFERELRAFAFKESEWRRERKRLKEEVKRLLAAEKSHRLEEEGGEERSSAVAASLDHHHHHQTVNEKDDEAAEREAAWREVTVEKWKKLYFAIKAELDDLIERTTHQEQRLCWSAEEEETLMKLNNELKSKEERIQLLQAKLAYVEDQKLRREREIDILRQSLRIMSHRKKATTTVVTSLAKIKTSNPRRKM